jgi:8-amino-7-oxononanoate synthase
MPTLNQHCTKALAQFEATRLRRHLRAATQLQGSPTHVMVDGRTLICFAANDYLGLRGDARVIAAGQTALAEYGAGAGASRLVTGNHPLYAPLEQKLAAMKGAEAALVFGSGYLTNLGVIPALMDKGDVIFADKLVHACIIDAAQLSGARLIRFAHNDMVHLETLLKAHREDSTNALIVTDHVFSMDGDIAPLAQLAALGEQYDAWTMADDAHGLGVVNAAAPMDIWMGTLSKAAGVYGGYVVGSQALIDFLTTAARSFVFSTGLPPAVCASAFAALEIIEAEPERGLRALAHARRITDALGLPAAHSAIVPIMFGTPERALAASEALKAKGLLAVAIRPPTVPQGTARLRLAMSASHTDAEVETLINALKEII